MFGAGLHKAGLSDLGGLGPRKLAGCRHPSAGELPDTWGSIFSALLLGPYPQPAVSPFCRLAQRAQRGLCLEGLRWGGVFQATLNPAGHYGCHMIEHPGQPQVPRHSLLWEGQAPGTPGLSGGRWLDFDLPTPSE